MTKQDYIAKKIAELNKYFPKTLNGIQIQYFLETFLSQTIEELWLELPEKKDEHLVVPPEWGFKEGWNACIAEAERMRDKQIKENI